MSAHADKIVIEFPASTRYISTVRVTAAGLVAEMDPDVDQVDDLRMAVNELVSALIEQSSGGTIRVEMSLGDETLGVTATASDPVGPIELDDLTRRILSATTEHHRVGDGTGELRMRFHRG